MRNKKRIEKILTKDLIKYSQQIGLPTIPRLVFHPKDWDELVPNKYRTKRDRWLGISWRLHNAIMVNLDYQGGAGRMKYMPSNYDYNLWRPTKWDLREARRTLVHELVHIRWKMSHGERFEKRIDEILRGRTFDEKMQ